MLLHLKDRGLIFTMTLPEQSNIIEELTTQVVAHLTASNLVLPSDPGAPVGSSSTPWFRLPWVFLKSTRRKAVHTFVQHPRANTNNFN
jgi:hypothetical protein